MIIVGKAVEIFGLHADSSEQTFAFSLFGSSFNPDLFDAGERCVQSFTFLRHLSNDFFESIAALAYLSVEEPEVA